MLNNPIHVETKTLADKLFYNDVLILSYKIEYPHFTNQYFYGSVEKINKYYSRRAFAYELYCRQKLAREAIQQYEEAMKNGFPFHPYEALLVYQITYNQDCTVSLYSDQYEYTGGAHGSTIRSSETWGLVSGRQIPLRNLFSRSVNYKTYLINAIIGQIEHQISQGQDYYFDDYKELVEENFHPDHYYLTKDGVVIYFQQYEIAPYSTGIPEFTIPYSQVLQPPRCR